MAIPKKDSELVAWSTNFDTRIQATPGDFGLTAAQATLYDARHDAFITAYNALTTARAAGMRQENLTTAKDDARRELLTVGREYYAFIQKSLSVSDENKNLAGVKIIDNSPSPVPRPAHAPGLDIVSVTGRTVRVKLHDSQNASRRGMPAGCVGATVISCVSTEIPTAGSNWKFEGNTGKLILDVQFPDTVTAGAQVWLAASWFNEAKEQGVTCTPVATNIQGGPTAMAA